MSSSRELSDKIAWDDDTRAIELLDWEAKPGDFDKLCEHIIGLLCTRKRWEREELFSILPEEQLRREIRATAETFQERFISLTMFIYMWLATRRLPAILRERSAGNA